MRRLDLGPDALTGRLRAASDLADLRPEHRLDAKIDLGAPAVTRRLELVSELREVCLELGRAAPTGSR